MDDQMMPGDRASAAAGAAAEAVRGLNHAAACGDGIGLPAAAYDILGSLSLAVSRLGPALAGIARYLDRALARGQLACDLRDDPGYAVATAAVLLGDARLQAASLAVGLSAAQAQIASLSARPSLQENQP